MHISPHHHRRQDDTASIPGLNGGGVTVTSDVGGSSLLVDLTAPADNSVATAPALVSGSNIVLTVTPTSSSSATASPSTAADVASASSSSNISTTTVIGACVGAFVGLAVLVCIFLAWYKRKTDKMSTSMRRNAAGQASQRRERAQSFQQLDDSEKSGPVPPPPPSQSHSQEMHESDEKNFSMFKKRLSVRTAYTSKTNMDEYDLPKLEFTKYHPSLAEELALENPDKPFAAAAAARQESGVSWDGQTLGDESFLSMRSVRVESGTMSPTMVMAKMTPPATASALHRWESAEVLHTDEEIAAAAYASAAPQLGSRNPFADMVEADETPRSRSNNPFFNARDAAESANRHSRHRSRSNSRTSRAQSLVRPESQHATVGGPSLNPFLDLHEAVPVRSIEVEAPLPDAFVADFKSSKSSVPSGASSSAFGSERAMASLIAALELPKEQVEERLRIVSMQGSTYSAYSNEESDIATMREFPLPPGGTPRAP